MTHLFLTPLSFSGLHGHVGAALLCCVATLAAAPAQASSPAEKVFCTNVPRMYWISEAQARERFQTQDYVMVKYKVSRGNCHEFYAVDAQGTVVESYLHPISGETVRSTRVPAVPSSSTKP